MEVLSIKLLCDILEDLIAKWATIYKLLVAREQSLTQLATGRPLILVPAEGKLYEISNITSEMSESVAKVATVKPCKQAIDPEKDVQIAKDLVIDFSNSDVAGGRKARLLKIIRGKSRCLFNLSYRSRLYGPVSTCD